MAKAPKRIHQMTFADWEKAFPTEDACRAYLTRHRWALGVKCPRCGFEAVEHGTLAWHWQCTNCSPSATSYRFSVTVGTIFENTNKPLRDWFRVIHMMLTSKKGVSALQVHRTMGFGSYRTAWYMCHRVRAGLANEEFRKLMGIVEVDETFIGGHAYNKHGGHDGTGGGRGNKMVVVGAIERKGSVVARALKKVTFNTLKDFVHEVVSDKVSLLATDEANHYRHLGEVFPHGTVNHGKKRYVVGAIHTNTIECFWSIFKRGIVGSYHKVSAKYLPLYVAEFQFRYNNRSNPDIFGTAIRGC